jgi:predicted phosphodiesterase
MKIWFISDTHCQHHSLTVPEDADLVIHCGDESNHSVPWRNEQEARDFFRWFVGLSIPKKIFVPGNHSIAVEKGLVVPSDYPSISFLIHDEIKHQGLRIFGSPYTPEFFDWAYMKPRDELKPIWESIPSSIDILITHGPPKGVLDVTRDMDTRQPIHVGSRSLRLEVENRIKPRAHAFGHIHDEGDIRNYGQLNRSGVLYLNASCCDLGGDLKNHGTLIELSERQPS